MDITDTQLITASISILVLGLIALAYATSHLEPLSYDAFVETPDETRAVIAGRIVGVRTMKNLTILDIETACTIPGIIFGQIDESVRDTEVIITGTKTTYEGKPEITVETIEQAVHSFK